MYYTKSLITILFFSCLVSNIVAQVSVPDTPYCDKPYEFLKNNCYECNNFSHSKKCKVEKFGFLGEANNKSYYYGVYLSEPFHPDYIFYHFAIYEGNSDSSDLKPIYFFYPSLGGYDYYDLEMTKTIYGYVIHIQLVEKIAGWDNGVYIIYRNGKWERLKQPNWDCAAKDLVPKNFDLDYLGSNDFVKINLKEMYYKIPVEEIVSGVYTPTDGYVIFHLTVEKDRFRIAGSEYIPDQKIRNTESDSVKDSFTHCEKTIDFLQNNCYTCDDSSKSTDCYDMEFKYLGENNSEQYYYGLYLLRTVDDDDSSYFVIYEGAKGDKKLKSVYFLPMRGQYSYNVEMVNTEYGLIIHILLENGNGGWDCGAYIINRYGKWKDLNIPDWTCVYESVIPEDTWFCKGNCIDLEGMTYTLDVYSSDDACCCPTRGTVTSKLTIDEDGFKVISSKYYPDLK